MLSLRKAELDKFLNALNSRILGDAPVLIKYLDTRREWDPTIYEVDIDKGQPLVEKEGDFFEVKSYSKSNFSPFLDKRIENLTNKKDRRARIVAGDGDHWYNSPENQSSIDIYKKAVQSGCNIKVMLTELGSWTVYGSANVLDSIGVSVGRVPASRELHGGVIGDEMYAICRYPDEGAQKTVGKSQPNGVNYTFLSTNFPHFVKSANSHLELLEKKEVPYRDVKKELENSKNSREDLLKM